MTPEITAADREGLDIARIAEGLTVGQRRGLLGTDPGESRDYAALHGIPRIALFGLGLLEHVPGIEAYRFRLTPLGLAVRAHLMKDEGR